MLLYSDFIILHRNDDVRDLALRQGRYPDVDMPYVVRQIAAWQMARTKLPLWAETDGVVYPVHLSMEQCSSQMTAAYKADILQSLFTEEKCSEEFFAGSMTDLTAGFGVDAVMMGRRFGSLNYVERNAELCEIAADNLPLLNVKHFNIINSDALDVLATLPHQSLIYLDPARRDANGGKTVEISDCTPDVSLIQERLLRLADVVMVKLSPMLDIKNVMRQLNGIVEIHVVSVDNECKELLVVMSASRAEGRGVKVHCVNLRSNAEDVCFDYDYESERTASCRFADPVDGTPDMGLGSYLYEPNASVMKAGCFHSLAERYGVAQLHPSSHLYVSDDLLESFPGRIFRIESVLGMKDKALKKIGKANLTVRNFPSTVAELRKRLKLADGGCTYLFATTLADERKVVIRCVKA